MARLHLVRHGQAAATWDADADPGLDDAGRAQAAAVAQRLGADQGRPIVCSPMRRTRETAQPLAARWGIEPALEPRVSEVPSPVPDLAARGAWLQELLRGTWTGAGADLAAWRDRLLAHLLGLGDAVVVTHFVAVNAVLGAIAGDDRVVTARVANASITVVNTDGGRFQLVEAPSEAPSNVW